MGKSEPLFKRITEDQVKDLKDKFKRSVRSENDVLVEEEVKPVKGKHATKAQVNKGGEGIKLPGDLISFKMNNYFLSEILIWKYHSYFFLVILTSQFEQNFF